MATKIDNDYLVDNFGIELVKELPQSSSVKWNEIIHTLIYDKLVSFVLAQNVDIDTTTELEEWLETDYDYIDYYKTKKIPSMMTSVEKIKWWKQALSYQTIQTVLSGDIDMINIQEQPINKKTWDLLYNTLSIIKRSISVK